MERSERRFFMKRGLLCFILLSGLAAPIPLYAQSSGGPVRMPGDECANKPFPANPAIVLSAEQEKTLRCWFDAGSNEAGIRLVQSYMADKPIAFAKVLAVLSVLVRDSIAMPGSLAERALSTPSLRSATIGLGDSISPVVERQRSPLAERILAQLYMAGLGVNQDPAAALKWIKRAEKGGDEVAKELHQEWLAKRRVDE
jgi:TPR repeat protein